MLRCILAILATVVLVAVCLLPDDAYAVVEAAAAASVAAVAAGFIAEACMPAPAECTLVREGFTVEDIALPAARAPHTRSLAVRADRLQAVQAIQVDRLQVVLADRSQAIPVMVEATVDLAGVMVLQQPALRLRPARITAAMATTGTRTATTMNTIKWFARSIDSSSIEPRSVARSSRGKVAMMRPVVTSSVCVSREMNRWSTAHSAMRA
ncbi:hypothetical protein [Bradyrhizobium uaiense]|uniref:hypothetical protein n=1 Tax=Bradyrhizobium uaiense TaxID=2594946 RepID=UPI001F22A59E|nr:hypothetical protein [Bradyrhizobium uaiense]